MHFWLEDWAAVLQRVIAWATLGILACAVLAYGAVIPVAWSLMCIGVLALFALQLLVDLVSLRPIPLNRLWFPGLLFLGVLVWTSLQRLPGLPDAWAHPAWTHAPGSPPLVSADPARGGQVILRFSVYAMVFWIAVRAAAEREAAMRYLRAFAVFSTGLALFGIYAWAVGSNAILGDSASNVVSASFVNRNNYATFAVFGMLANLAIFFNHARSWETTRANPILGFLEGFFGGGWIWIFGVILCGGAILLTQSRAGAAAGLIGLVVFLSSYRSRGALSSVGPLVTVVVLAAGVAITASAGVIERLLATSDENGRFAVYPHIVEGIMDRPLLGHGLGAFEDAFRPYVPLNAASGEWDMAHNSYLENAFELGLPAAAALYLALGLIGLRLIHGMAIRQRGRTILACALGSFIAAAFHAGFDFSLQMPALAASFVFLLGLGYAQSFREEDIKITAARRRKRQFHDA